MSPLQFLAWLTQTITFTGVAFNVLILLLSFFYHEDVIWWFFVTIPLTIIAAFVWLALHLLSSFVVKNDTSKLGWILIAGWIIAHAVVYFINIRDLYDALVPMLYFNAAYLVVSAILLFAYRKLSQEVVEISKPRFFRLDIQIILSIGLALLIIAILSVSY